MTEPIPHGRAGDSGVASDRCLGKALLGETEDVVDITVGSHSSQE
jgi:hypothetical protein